MPACVRSCSSSRDGLVYALLQPAAVHLYKRRTAAAEETGTSLISEGGVGGSSGTGGSSSDGALGDGFDGSVKCDERWPGPMPMTTAVDASTAGAAVMTGEEGEAG